LRTTAESHHRALVFEVMGRHAGWIALHSGIAGGANVILGAGAPVSNVEKVVEVDAASLRAPYAPIIVVAEGAMPEAAPSCSQR